MPKNTITFTDDNFRSEVLESDVPVLVDFWAEWCGPCHVLGPTIDELAETFGTDARIGKLDVDANSRTAAAYRVMAIPTVLIFQNGEVAGSLLGVQPKRAYEEALKKLKVTR